MLIHAVAQNRGALTLTLCALMLVVAGRAAFAQDNASLSTGPNAVSPDPQASHQPAAPAASSAPAPEGFFTEPRVITHWMNFVDHKFAKHADDKTKSGFYPELSNMISGAGWLVAGPGYRRYFDNDRILLDGSAAVSWHMYKMTQGRFELPTLVRNHLVIGVQGMWQDATQVNYYGIGPDSLEDAKSQYRMQTTDVVGYATLKPKDWLSFGGEYGFLKQPKIMAPGGTFVPNLPETQVVFREDPGVALTNQPHYLHAEEFVTVDTRDHTSYPSSGGMYRGAFTAYSSGDAGEFSFTQYEGQAEHFFPLAEERWVLGFRAWTVYSNVPSGNEIPFYLLPTLGGNNTLRDFGSYRFHDNNLLVLNGESRFAIYQHVDLALFLDVGNVAAAYGDLNLDKTSYGVGVRLHTNASTIGRLDIADGPEGLRVVFRTGDPFHLSREKRRIANAPFAP